MLPLSDRVLLTLRDGPTAARRMSRDLGADPSDLYRVLRALQAEGAIERVYLAKEASTWRLAPGVHVRLEPSRVIVEGAKPAPWPPYPIGQHCHAATTLGRPCLLQAGAGGLCFLHAPRPHPPTGAGGGPA